MDEILDVTYSVQLGNGGKKILNTIPMCMIAKDGVLVDKVYLTNLYALLAAALDAIYTPELPIGTPCQVVRINYPIYDSSTLPAPANESLPVDKVDIYSKCEHADNKGFPRTTIAQKFVGFPSENSGAWYDEIVAPATRSRINEAFDLIYGYCFNPVPDTDLRHVDSTLKSKPIGTK